MKPTGKGARSTGRSPHIHIFMAMMEGIKEAGRAVGASPPLAAMGSGGKGHGSPHVPKVRQAWCRAVSGVVFAPTLRTP